jgi:predicted transposase/invertase (TIGR01784 family)
METDAFFCQLLKELPQTLFQLLGMPATRAKAYRFDSVELKKSFRIDGLFLPRKSSLPLYFVEIQFRRTARFYANLFAKVFCYLEENDPEQEWVAVAIFGSKNAEPANCAPYDDLLRSRRVKRIYLDTIQISDNPPLGLGMLHLLSAPIVEAPHLVDQFLNKADAELASDEARSRVIELLEELLIRRLPDLSREEIRAMFHLTDLRKTRVWQEAHEEGVQEGIEKGIAEGIEKGIEKEKKEVVKNLLSSGFPVKQIAELVKMPIHEVRRLAKS